MAGKRVSLASLAASKVESVPGASRPDLVHVHPDTVAPTPLNPRRQFDETELAELGEDMRAGQLQPCVAVSKAAYLKLYPEHEERLPASCRYVMAAGERRWRAALKAGLDSLDVMLRHDLTESRVRFLSAVLSENVQRANFNPIEEADGLRAMLELHDGNQSAAAKAMGKSKAWFNQRIGLLRLTDEMVQLVLEGKLTAFRDMRRYAALPAEQQYETWKRDQEQPAPAPAQAPAVRSSQELPGPQTYTAVYASSGSTGADGGVPAPTSAVARPVEPSSGPADYHGVIIPEDRKAPRSVAAPASAVPAQPTPAAHPAKAEAPEAPPSVRPAPAASDVPAEYVQEGRRFPYDDCNSAGMHLSVKMSDDVFLGTMAVMYRQAIARGLTPPCPHNE